MRVLTLVAFPLLSLIQPGCGATDSATPPAPRDPVEIPLSVAVAAEALSAGESSTGTVRLNRAAPDDGAEIALWSSDISALLMPPTVSIPAGTSMATFVLTNSYGGKTKLVQIRANYGDDWAETSLFIPRLPPDEPPCKGHACPM